jgi:hypothetical protein
MRGRLVGSMLTGAWVFRRASMPTNSDHGVRVLRVEKSEFLRLAVLAKKYVSTVFLLSFNQVVKR